MRRGRGGVSVGATMVRAGREGPGGVAALGPGIDESGRRQQAPTNYGPRRTRQSAPRSPLGPNVVVASPAASWRLIGHRFRLPTAYWLPVFIC